MQILDSEAVFNVSPIAVLPATRDRIDRAMRGFSKPVEADPTDGRTGIRVGLTAEDLPPAPLILLLLQNVMDFPDHGRADKVAWQISFNFSDIPAVMAFEKFGLRLYLWPEKSKSGNMQPVVDEVCRLLNKGVAILQRDFLRNYARDQLDAGEVLIPNSYGSLRGRYVYFRRRARLSYESKSLLPLEVDDSIPDYARVVGSFMANKAEGSHNTLAMTTFFFSFLEHYLVLMQPFLHPVEREPTLSRIISGSWSEKFKATLNIEKDSEARLAYETLYSIAEDWRNPYAHGGFGKQGAGVYVYLDHVGVVPARLTDVRTDLVFSFMPVKEFDHEELCSAFDSVEDLLKTNSVTRLAHIYIHGGLDVHFDSKARERYRIAQRTDEAFEAMCDEIAYHQDRSANMDW
jgi:hypothetical protein